MEGSWIGEMVVSSNGIPSTITPSREASDFDETAVETLAKWRYEPIVVNGHRIKWRSKITLNFRLR